MNKMYMELDQIFQLNFGSILLGTTSPDLLLTMVEMERPYFHRHNRDSLLRCLSNGTDCQTPRWDHLDYKLTLTFQQFWAVMLAFLTI